MCLTKASFFTDLFFPTFYYEKKYRKVERVLQCAPTYWPPKTVPLALSHILYHSSLHLFVPLFIHQSLTFFFSVSKETSGHLLLNIAACRPSAGVQRCTFHSEPSGSVDRSQLFFLSNEKGLLAIGCCNLLGQ